MLLYERCEIIYTQSPLEGAVQKFIVCILVYNLKHKVTKNVLAVILKEDTN